MTSRKKLFTVLFVLWGLPLMVIFGGAAWVNHVGMIVVDVDEHGKGGSHVHMKIPAAMVQAGLHFVPDVVCEDASRDVERWSPLIRELCSELDKMEDGVLVEVTGGRENVGIRKKDRSLLIDVESDEETVHVTMPIGTVRAVLDKFEGLHGTLKVNGRDSSVTL